MTAPNLDALNDQVEDLRRRAANHRPRKDAWRRLRDARCAQLRSYIAKRKLDQQVVETDSFWRRCIASLGFGRAA